MWAVDLVMSSPFTARIVGMTGILIMATALGWTAARILDPGVQARGLTVLAGLIGLSAGTWLAGHAGWDPGPAVLGYSLIPAFLATLTTCGCLKLVTLGVSGSV